MRLGQTPWQTVGPFFHYALPWPGCGDMAGGGECDMGSRLDLVARDHLLPSTQPGVAQSGEVIALSGRVVDGAGEPTPDVLIETWQADPSGRYDSSGFQGFGRAATADDGSYRLRLIRPGRTPGPGNALQAPHLAISVMGRGLLRRLVTRAYFEGDDGLDEDPVLALTPLERRSTLIARRSGESAYRFDIVLQGQGETVFFEF